MKKTIKSLCDLLCLCLLGCSCASAESHFFSYLADPSSRSSLVAFSPTHHDPRPGKEHRIPSRQSLRDDLQALRPAFDGLILYGYDRQITPIILEEAKRLGYRAVLLGIWDSMSKDEIAGIAQLVHQYQQQLALAVCVGNEGIAFARYTLDDVRRGIDLLRALLEPDASVPLCTSEPIDQYVDDKLRQVGDFLCPNIHFVFEHPEKSPADAARWVRGLGMSLAESAHKPVMVKETGLPHGAGEHFSPAAQEAFWASYLERGTLDHTLDFYHVWISYAAAFEAFDLDWKAEQSKMMIEGMWGVLAPDRKPYPAFYVMEKTRTSTPSN
jgi:exo-beta-1,3-glucanase (GH17 family)